MYSARHAQGGPVLWEPAYEVQGQRRLAVVTALREALSSGAIGVHFQPKVESLSGQVTGVEALARWTHPALGAIGPDEFIPLAEASGLMGALTSSVLRQSLTACRGWQRRAGARRRRGQRQRRHRARPGLRHRGRGDPDGDRRVTATCSPSSSPRASSSRTPSWRPCA